MVARCWYCAERVGADRERLGFKSCSKHGLAATLALVSVGHGGSRRCMHQPCNYGRQMWPQDGIMTLGQLVRAGVLCNKHNKTMISDLGDVKDFGLLLNYAVGERLACHS